MRDLVVTENITLDGVIDASGGWFDVTDNPQATSPTSRRRWGSRPRRPTRSSSVG